MDGETWGLKSYTVSEDPLEVVRAILASAPRSSTPGRPLGTASAVVIIINGLIGGRGTNPRR